MIVNYLKYLWGRLNILIGGFMTIVGIVLLTHQDWLVGIMSLALGIGIYLERPGFWKR